jgi:hypothetical protein
MSRIPYYMRLPMHLLAQAMGITMCGVQRLWRLDVTDSVVPMTLGSKVIGWGSVPMGMLPTSIGDPKENHLAVYVILEYSVKNI